MLSLRIFAPRRTNHLGFTYSKEATPHVEALKQSLIGDITWEVAYRSYMIALLGESQREKDTHPEFTAHIRKLMDERILAVNTILDVLIESLTDKHYHYARLLELRRYRLDIDDAMFDTLLKSLEALKTKGQVIVTISFENKEGGLEEIPISLTGGRHGEVHVSQLFDILERLARKSKISGKRLLREIKIG